MGIRGTPIYTPAGKEVIDIKDSIATGETGIEAAFDRGSGDVNERLQVGVTDSGGVGKRAIVVPNVDAAPVLSGCVEVTSQSTSSATMVDIPGCTFNLTLNEAGKIYAVMTVSSTASAASIVGAWDVSIDGTACTEIQRTIATGTDKGSIAIQSAKALSAGTYTVKGRHRLVSGSGTLYTDVAQLTAEFRRY